MMNRMLRFVLPLLLVLTSSAAFGQTRYFMVMFGAEGSPSTARSSHTFATFVAERDGRILEEKTISWLPAQGHFGPDYTMPPLRVVPGRNYTLDQTMAMSPGRSVRYWGPMEISPELYRRASLRVGFLSRSSTSYKMMLPVRNSLREPALHNQAGGAINCIMAVSDIGGYLDTGTAWGVNASSRVLSSLSPSIYDDLRSTSTPHPDVARAMNLQRRVGH